MLIDFKHLRNLPVETESGVALGHIVNFTLETDSLSIKQITVSSSKLPFFNEELLINVEQILSITSEKVVVVENVKRIPITEPATQNLKQEAVPLHAETQN